MDASRTARSGRRRALAYALALALAALAWLAQRGLRTQGAALPALGPPQAEIQREPPPVAAPLESPPGEPSSERSAGALAQQPPPAPAADTQPAIRPRQFRGLVLDEGLHMALPNVVLVFEADPAREVHRTRSDERGLFRTPQLAEAPRWLRAEPPEGYLESERIDLAAEPGNILVALQRDPQTLAGPIRGELLSESGPWTAATLPKRGSVMLDLVPSDGAKWSARAGLIEVPDDHGHVRLTFEFESLPRGDYLLTLSSLSAWRWSPTSLRVSPPAENLSFLRYDLDRATELVFRVRDRKSGEAIEKYETRALSLSPSQDNGLFLHTGPFESAAVPEDARFQWSLWAEGYRPVFGDETAFVRRDGERVAEVELERGWATKLLVLARDPTARPAAHASVRPDGRAAGETGADGMLVLAADEAPAQIVVELAGWKMTNDPLKDYNGKSAAQRGQVTIVMLEKDK